MIWSIGFTWVRTQAGEQPNFLILSPSSENLTECCSWNNFFLPGSDAFSPAQRASQSKINKIFETSTPMQNCCFATFSSFASNMSQTF